MIWINSIVTISFLSLLSFLRGCDWMQQPIELLPSPENRIYFNSFESSSDTIGWKGWMEFRNDAPRFGGKQSAYVSGGCLVPHTSYQLPSSSHDRKLVLRCWGKNLEIGGVVELEAVPEVFIPENPKNYIFVVISDTIWKSYRSESILYCPANSKLVLSMSSGGYIPSAMLVDLLEIIEVK
ncbi:MAG: hypothetical protein HZB59_05330 [Ignavibacteriales bacterium]|nr:hypothetical protein [Ignavibacteriales bacterium]